jgi:hypothetical protein
LGAKLETHRDDAMLARQLTGIACDAPIDDPEIGLQPSAPRLGEINALFDEAGIGTALRRQAEKTVNHSCRCRGIRVFPSDGRVSRCGFIEIRALPWIAAYA